MDELLRTLRSLRSDFTVVRRSEDELALAVDITDASGRATPAVLRFIRPMPWAGRWDATRNEWQDCASPEYGVIVEAFAKFAGGKIHVSFSDRTLPLVRWGLTAQEVSIEPSDSAQVLHTHHHD